MLRILISSFILVSATVPVSAQEFIVNRLSDEVLVITARFSWWEVNITAVSTEEGIVVIDTLYHPEAARKAQAIIEKEFTDRPIKYVINTHSHPDHTFGNAVFESAFVIGHRYIPEELALATTSNLATVKQMIPAMQAQLQTLKAQDPEKAKVLEDRLEWCEMMRSLVEDEGFVPTPPALLLDGNATVRLGGKTFKILRLGPFHTNSDLMVFVPEEKLLVLGDLYHRGNLPYINVDIVGDPQNLITIYDKLVELGDQVEHYVPGHGPVANVEYLKEQRSYIQDLVKAVRDAKSSGLTLEKAKAEILLSDYHHFSSFEQIHAANIENCWKTLDETK